MSSGTTEPKIFYAPVGSTDFVELGEPVIADFSCVEPSRGFISPLGGTSITFEYKLSPDNRKSLRSLRNLFNVRRLPRKRKKAYKKLISRVYPLESKVSTIYGNYKLK